MSSRFIPTLSVIFNRAGEIATGPSIPTITFKPHICGTITKRVECNHVRVRERLADNQATIRFHHSTEFVTDGLEQAIAMAETAAGEQNVTVVGGASVTQQCIRAGLFDELHIALVPLLLCEGLQLFENIGNEPIRSSLSSKITRIGR